MFTFFIMLITLSFGLSLVITTSPLVLGVWILLLSILVSVLCRTTFSSWFGLIMFLIYIGGMLVIFAYFAAIQPNQQFNIKLPLFFILLSSINLPINIYPVLVNLFFDNRWWISSLFYIYNISVVVLLGFVLFLALICVVKITTLKMAPLRPYNYV